MEPTSTDAWTKKRSWGGRFGRQVSKIIRENMKNIQKSTTFNFFLLGFPANVTILVELLVYKNCCSIYCVGGWGLDPYYNSMVSFCCDPFSFPSISTPDKAGSFHFHFLIFHFLTQVRLDLRTMSWFPAPPLPSPRGWPGVAVLNGVVIPLKWRSIISKKIFWWRSANPHNLVHLQKIAIHDLLIMKPTNTGQLNHRPSGWSGSISKRKFLCCTVLCNCDVCSWLNRK